MGSQVKVSSNRDPTRKPLVYKARGLSTTPQRPHRRWNRKLGPEDHHLASRGLLSDDDK